jgi:hypothetical protein
MILLPVLLELSSTPCQPARMSLFTTWLASEPSRVTPFGAKTNLEVEKGPKTKTRRPGTRRRASVRQ